MEDLPCKAPVRLMGGQRERVEGTVNKHSALPVCVGVFQGGFGKISHGRHPATCAGCGSETLSLSALRWERSQPVHLMFESNEATFNKADSGSVTGPLLLLLLPLGLLSRLFNNLDKCS